MSAAPKVKTPKVKIPKIAGLFQAAVLEERRIPAPDYLLGLDMSVEHTGWSLFNTTTGEFKGGVFEPNPNQSKKVVKVAGMRRLLWVRNHVMNMARYGMTMAEIGDPNGRWVERISCLVIIEGYAFGAKGQSGISLGELGGIIRLGLYDEGIGYVEIPPTQLKKFVTGSGGGDKAIMLKEIYKRWGADFNDDNAADAYSLVQLGRALTSTYNGDLLAHQKVIVSDVMKTWLKEHPEEGK